MNIVEPGELGGAGPDVWLRTDAHPLVREDVRARLRERVVGIVVPLDAGLEDSPALRRTRKGMLLWAREGGAVHAWVQVRPGDSLGAWLRWLDDHSVRGVTFQSAQPHAELAAAVVTARRRGMDAWVSGLPPCLSGVGPEWTRFGPEAARVPSCEPCLVVEACRGPEPGQHPEPVFAVVEEHPTDLAERVEAAARAVAARLGVTWRIEGEWPYYVHIGEMALFVRRPGSDAFGSTRDFAVGVHVEETVHVLPHEVEHAATLFVEHLRRQERS